MVFAPPVRRPAPLGIGGLQKKLGTVTDPNQQARIQQRIKYLGNQQPQQQQQVRPGMAGGTVPQGQQQGVPGTQAPPATGGGAPPATNQPQQGQQTATGQTGGVGIGAYEQGQQKANPANAVTPAAPGTDLAALQARRAFLKRELMKHAQSGTQRPGLRGQFDAISQQIRGLRNPQVPAGETPGPGDTTTGDTGNPGDTGTQNPDPNSGTPDDSGLFPSARGFMREDYEGSPTYQFQKREGMKGLERLMAARGLTNSGAELEANAKLLNELGSNESDRWQNQAQQEADRLERIQGRESDRLTGREDAQWNRMTDLLGFAERQNPMQYAFQGLGDYAKTGLERGKNKAAFVRDRYGRVVPRGGAGGYAGPAPVFQPPFPSSPDYSMINMINAANGASDRKGWGGTITDLLSGFFK